MNYGSGRSRYCSLTLVSPQLNYFPLCLLDTMGKKLKQVVYHRLSLVAESQETLSDQIINTIELVTDMSENAIHGKGTTNDYCVVVTAKVMQVSSDN